MSVSPDGFGGRLPLAECASLTDAQREIFDQMTTAVVPWAREAGFQATTDDGRFIGPFNACLLNPAIAAQFLKLQFAEAHTTSLSKRARQVVILTVGAVWRAGYELYAHSAAARHQGLRDADITTLVGGGMPENLTEPEKIAHRLARQLTTSHHVDDQLYRDAEKALGAKGILELTILTGIYHTVCGIINVFDVPAP